MFFTYRLNVEGGSLEDEEQTTLFRLSSLFNPVTLFCIFLSEVIFLKHSHKRISCAMFHEGLVICSSLKKILNVMHLCFPLSAAL